GDAVGVVDPGSRRRSAVAAESSGGGAGERGDGPVRGDLADAAVAFIGDVDVPLAIDGHANRVAQRSGCGQAPLTEETPGALARDGADAVVRRIHLANDIVVTVGNVDVALAVHGNAAWVAQPCIGGSPQVAREAGTARHAGERHDGLAADHLADNV